jgi:hypothetical protein
MAKKPKNKASKCWISKEINEIKSMPQEERYLWGPVSIALGVTALSNGALDLSKACPTSIIEWIPVCASILFGLVWFIFGIWVSARSDRKIRAGIAITAGFALLFVGTHIVSLNLIDVLIGWLIIIGSLIAIIIGFYLYFIDKKRRREELK